MKNKGVYMNVSALLLDLRSTFVILNKELLADTIPVTDTIWNDIDRKYGDFAGHTLVASFSFDKDWPTWEVHPHGDEVVCLITGDVEMILATKGGETKVRLDSQGSFVVVPKNTWHTAKVHAPAMMLFITPGEGTENREIPDDL